MIPSFELNYFKRAAKINYILLTLYLSLSISAHAIANRLVLIDGYPIISAGLIYMSTFILTDIFASFNPRKLVIMMISLEAFANFIYIAYTNWISSMPYPAYFHHADAYTTVFRPIIILYLANLGGTFIAAVVGLFIFYYLYRTKRWPFYISSFMSSIVTITCYTLITDYFGFRHSYPEHVFTLTNINLITNFMTLAFYAIVGQFIVVFIQKCLDKNVQE